MSHRRHPETIVDDQAMKRPLSSLDRNLLASHCRYAAEAWQRFGGAPDPALPVAAPGDDALMADAAAALRRYRQLQSVHILWRDLSGAADIATTGQALATLARECVELALTVAERTVAGRHGWITDDTGARAGLIVFGLGKLGGDELNFNSDIDLVFAHAARGHSSGPGRVEAAEWMTRVARELIGLLDRVDAHGRVWIVDTRLRPFGESGALVWSIPAMEQYFVSEGRTWERYAWLKAAPIAGDLAAGRALIDTLQPFIYRRYLDYGIFESLRELHRQIDASARPRSRRDDIKRGRGGIRELEFLVQSLQILRGGREPALRTTGFLPALAACVDAGLMPAGQARELRAAYGFLRILENRLQAMTARQGHALPAAPLERQRLAELMGLDHFDKLAALVHAHRRAVSAHFGEHFRAPPTQAETARPAVWPPGEDSAARLAAAGFEHPQAAAEALRRACAALARRPLSAQGRQRLDRLMPSLIEVVARQQPPDTGLADLLRLVDQISRRSSYLALLRERPETLERLVRVFHASQRVAEWIIAAPQLIDDLLDPVHGVALPDAPEADPNDPEASLLALSRWRQAGFLRTALAELDGRMSAVDAGRQLSFLAAIVIDRALALAGDRGRELAVIGYGNLGAFQLHFESDLDLVFLHRAGPPLRRVAQRLISTLHMPLPGGRLFAIDTRLRPNGRAGLLVSTLESFADYQYHSAWTWEHQALIRARWIAGDQTLESEFDEVRTQVLGRRRSIHELTRELADMRQRQRRQRGESPIAQALTDLQAVVELGVLARAAEHPQLLAPRTIGGQLDALAEIGWLDDALAQTLTRAWRTLLAQRHLGWLAREPIAIDEQAVEAIAAAWKLSFPESRRAGGGRK